MHPGTCMSALVGLLVVLVFAPAVLVIAQSPDLTCLQKFKASVGDPQGHLLSWDFNDTSPKSVCSWFGVTCYGNYAFPVYFLSLGSSELTGSFPDGLSDCKALKWLDLSANNFVGPIPDSLCSDVPNLVNLDLSRNKIRGSIPANLSLCSFLNNIVLNDNELSGTIPGQIGLLGRLKKFDVSNNQLEGLIPSTFVDRKAENGVRFDGSSFENNAGLCGPPLTNNCTAPSGGANSNVILGGAIGGALVAAVVGALVVWFLGRPPKKHAAIMRDDSKWAKHIKASKSINVAMFDKPLVKIRLADLMAATNEFSKDNIVGSGRTGTVYKAMFPDGSAMAIKRLQVSAHSDRQFKAEMETLGQVKHPNLLSLLGYCVAGGERLLVYKHMPKGSLRDCLHNGPEKEILEWPVRVKIAIGASRGLAWLHDSCNPRMIHRNISAGSILLDDDYDSKITDFGLARLTNPVDTHISTFVNGDFGDVGYVAPEYVRTLVATTKGDVYSFGIVLLELVTSQKPVDVLVDGDFKGNLAEWIRMLSASGRIADAIDRSLTGKGVDDELMQILKVACSCVLSPAKGRPSMYEVYQVLLAIGQKQTHTYQSERLSSAKREFIVAVT